MRVETQGICLGHTLMDQGLKKYFGTTVFLISKCILSFLLIILIILNDLTQMEFNQPLDWLFPCLSCLDG